MKKQALFCVMTVIALSGMAQQNQSAGPRSSGTSSRQGGYATDQFEGFEEVQVDGQLTQKGWSMWYSVSESIRGQTATPCEERLRSLAA
jgi:hypothetical protein